MARRSDDAYSAHTAVSQPQTAPGGIAKPETTHNEQPGSHKRAEALGLELGSERRKHLERKLKLKLDLRFSILVSNTILSGPTLISDFLGVCIL